MKKITTRIVLALCFIVCTLFLFNSIYASAETLTKYNIDVNFNENSKTLSASESVLYTNNYNKDLNNIVLHLYPDSFNSASSLPSIGQDSQSELANDEIGDISIEKVLVDNKDVVFTADNQVLKINLATPLAHNNVINLQIKFTVKIPAGTDRLGYMKDVYSITNWYPIMSIYDSDSNTWDENEFNPIGESNYSDASDYTVTLHTPKNIVTASTGVVKKSVISGDIKTIEITSTKTRDFVFMMSKYFKTLYTIVNGVRINSFYIDDKSSDDTSVTAKKVLDVVADSEKFYSQSFGKYPYPQLDVVETYLSGGAMEYPSLIQMGKYDPWPKNTVDDHSTWLEDAAAHETGHQWWYVAVGNNEFKEPVMDESINTFSTAYYFEKRYGKYNKNSITTKFRNNLIVGKTLPIDSSVDKFNNWDDYSRVIYQKGPEAFEDLRKRVGDDKFLKIMQTYFSIYEFKNGSVDDFIKIVGEIGGSEAKTAFSNAVSSGDYYPSNIAVTSSEAVQINNIDAINDLKLRELTNGLTLGSMLLRGMTGEKIYLVVPSKLTSSEKKHVDSYVNRIKTALEKSYYVKIYVEKDTQIDSKQLLENMIVLGNPNNNKIINKLQNSLPIKINGKEIILKNKKIKGTNTSGIYIVKNPINKNKLIMVNFWSNSIYSYDFINDNSDQYIIHYNESDEIRGQF